MSEKKSEIIESVKTPLGFFTLVVLLIEIIFGVVSAFVSPGLQSFLVISMVLLIFCLVGVVAYLAVRHPEALRGERRPQFSTDLNSIEVGNDVVLLEPRKKKILLEANVVEWNNSMNPFIGQIARVTSIDMTVMTCRINLDSEAYEWHFDWIMKIPNKQ